MSKIFITTFVMINNVATSWSLFYRIDPGWEYLFSILGALSAPTQQTCGKSAAANKAALSRISFSLRRNHGSSEILDQPEKNLNWICPTSGAASAKAVNCGHVWKKSGREFQMSNIGLHTSLAKARVLPFWMVKGWRSLSHPENDVQVQQSQTQRLAKPYKF